jgi:hypothetical protein
MEVVLCSFSCLFSVHVILSPVAYLNFFCPFLINEGMSRDEETLEPSMYLNKYDSTYYSATKLI